MLPRIQARMGQLRSGWRAVLLTVLALSASACTNLGAVRDFSRSAASMTTAYPVAAHAYVDSAVTSAPYRLDDRAATAADAATARPSASASATAGASASATATSTATTLSRNPLRTERQQQVDAALALQEVLADYFQTLAQLAGDDITNLATAKAVTSEVRSLANGSLGRTTLAAADKLLKTVGDFAQLPARESSVRALVEAGGPDAMRLLEVLRSVAADWRAQVANDARQVDDTLGIAVLPSDVPPLLRLLAADRRAALAKDYAATLRRMGSVVRSLESLADAHRDMAEHVDDLRQDAVRRRLGEAAADLRAARDSLLWLR